MPPPPFAVRSIVIGCEGRSTEHPDATLAGLAGRQGGVVSRSQLLDRGWSGGAVDRRLASGHLAPFRIAGRTIRGVYALGGATIGDPGRWWAALLACGPAAVLHGRTAGAVLDLGASSLLEVAVRPQDRRRPPAPIAVRRLGLDPHLDVVERDGLRVTRWPRTCLDIAALGTARQLRTALDRTVTLRLFDRAAMDDLLERRPHAHGVMALRRALAELDDLGARAHPGLEVDLRELVLGSDLPRPLVDAPVLPPYRGDLVFAEQMVIVEADGARWHDGPIAAAADHERQARLEAAGWLVLRVRWDDVHRHSQRTLRRIAAALARRSVDRRRR